MNTIQWILVLSLLVSTCVTVRQEIEIFSGSNQNGTSVIFRDKISDLKDWKLFLTNAKSYCVTGFWNFYESTNFTGEDTFQFTGNGGSENGYEERNCGTFYWFGDYNSARYFGPSDTRTIAISVYEGSFLGVEVVVEDRTGNNFQLSTTKAMTVHGIANWTLFTGDNFDGESWCRYSNGYLFSWNSLNTTHPVRSVVRDCL